MNVYLKIIRVIVISIKFTSWKIISIIKNAIAESSLKNNKGAIMSPASVDISSAIFVEKIGPTNMINLMISMEKYKSIENPEKIKITPATTKISINKVMLNIVSKW